MGFETFVSDVVATVIGGVLLAMLFFLLKERAFPLPDINGRWFFELRTKRTEYGPYQGMVLRYLAFLWRQGSQVHGTIEKLHEISSTGERSFVGVNRTRGSVTGCVEKNYSAPDRIVLHIVEEGTARQSSHLQELVMGTTGCMTGTFLWTVAEQSGDVTWQRTAHQVVPVPADVSTNVDAGAVSGPGEIALSGKDVPTT